MRRLFQSRTAVLRAAVAFIAVSAVASLVPAAVAPAPLRPSSRVGGDWLRFGYTPSRSGVGPTRTGITVANVGSLVRTRVSVGAAIDSSPVYVRGALIRGTRHDVFAATTAYGQLVAVDAGSKQVLWTFTPRGYDSWAGTYRITTASPVVDRSGTFVYSAAPDGFVYKIRVADGTAVRSAGWPLRVTRSPAFEKLSSPLNITSNRLLVSTSSFEDGGDYQGHVVIADLRTGRVLRVWNALCGRTRRLLVPSTCGWNGAGIWARSGIVVQPGTGDLLFSTGNGVWDGVADWSNSVIVLSPDGRRRIGSWTPKNWMQLASADLDLSSTGPAFVSPTVVVQGGKDGKLRLLDLRVLDRKRRKGLLGHELHVLAGPGGLYTAPAVWKHGGQTWVYVATGSELAAYTFTRGTLADRWSRPISGSALGTSPVVAGGLLYLNQTDDQTLDVYEPTSGKLVASLPAGGGHWNTPIVTDGRIALGEGDANVGEQTGALDVYSLPGS